MSKRFAAGKIFGLLTLTAAASGLVATIWLLPRQQVKELPVSERIPEETNARAVLINGIGGLLFFLTAYLGWKNYSTEKEKQLNESFSSALEMLNSDKVHIRLGGIYALERIARYSKQDERQALNLLAAYVRGKSGKVVSDAQNEELPTIITSLADLKEQDDRNREASHYGYDVYDLQEPPDDDEILFGNINKRFDSVCEVDIQAAISTIGSINRSMNSTDQQIIDLSRIRLKGVVFTGNFNNISLYKSYLECPEFRNASFHDGDFADASLVRPHFHRCICNRANFENSIWVCPSLENTEFLRSTFSKATFSGGSSVENCQFNQATMREWKVGGSVPNFSNAESDSYVSYDTQSSFYNVFFDKATLEWAGFRDVKIEGCSFVRTQLQKIVIEGVQFSGSRFNSASFYRAQIGNLHWSTSGYSFGVKQPQRLSEVVFNHCEFNLADFSHALIVGTAFNAHQKLTKSQVTEANLDEETVRFDDPLHTVLGLPKKHKEPDLEEPEEEST